MKPLSQYNEQELLILVMSALVVIVAFFALLMTVQILSLFRKLLREQQGDVYQEESALSLWYKKLTNAVPIENEQSILLHHDYDGIKELDNHLPPWWVYLFYGTIGFAAVYLLAFHILDYAPLPKEELRQEIAIAKVEVENYRKTMANSIDESNVTLITKHEELEPGKAVFTNNCKACHGGAGEGGIGPNLTDQYWLHGADIKKVFKIVKDGVPAKGMIAWNTKLTPLEIQQVASYVLSLQGTNPANPKAPQGDLVQSDKKASASGTETDKQA
ncbi:MAG: cbb3-type cytochrome c oxidase N-terminal domain-containing protein, partial [Flexibacteraceae bacterium]